MTTNMIIDFLLYTVAAFVGLVVFAFCLMFCVALYRVYVKKDIKVKRINTSSTVTKEEVDMIRDLFAVEPEKTMQIISQFPEEQQKQLIEAIKRDERQWISLDVEKNGDTLYFYDMNDSNGKFLFQCKTYDEMLENLEKIRGNRGVRIGVDLVKKLEMEDFFVKPGTRIDESI